MPWPEGMAIPCRKPEPISSKSFNWTLRHPETQEPLFEYEYYVRLRTDTSWRVPVLHGKIPKSLANATTMKDKAMFALFVMLLFRPHRKPQDLFEAAIARQPPPAGPEQAFERLIAEYERWKREEVTGVAEKFFDRSRHVAAPKFNSLEWWACMVALRLRNLELTLTRHGGGEFDKPADDECHVLPHTPAPDATPSRAARDCAAGNDEGAASDGSSDDHVAARARADDDLDDDDGAAPVAERQPFPIPELRRCGVLPDTVSLQQFHSNASLKNSRHPEVRYAQAYIERRDLAFDGEQMPRRPAFAPEDTSSLAVDPGDATRAAMEQSRHFRDVDDFCLDGGALFARSPLPDKLNVERALSKKFKGKSETIVVEAAVCLLRAGFLDVSLGDEKQVNAKQAMAFLWWACWLQFRMNDKWRSDGLLLGEPLKDSIAR